MKDIPEEELGKIVGNSIAQSHLVIRCLIRALIQTPNFDAKKFVDILASEESKMTEDAKGAKDSIRQIIAETEGYL